MMKKLLIILTIVFFVSCSEQDSVLELSNPEAFAFDLGDSWEVNSSVKAMGFLLNQIDNNYESNLVFFVDLVLPNNDTIRNIYSDSVIVSEPEIINDIILEAQIDIESSFGEGNYKLLYHVKDMLANKNDTISVAFNLSK